MDTRTSRVYNKTLKKMKLWKEQPETLPDDLQEILNTPPERFSRELEEMEAAGFNLSEIYDVPDGQEIVYPPGYLEWQDTYTKKVAKETGEEPYSLMDAIRDRERLEKSNIKIDRNPKRY